MANPILGLMTDSFPDSIEGLTNQISQIEENISAIQEEKDALITAMQDIRQQVLDIITAQADYIYKGPAFYSGNDGDDASRSINVSDWRAFNIVNTPVNGTNYFDVTTNPPTSKTYNDGSDPENTDPISTFTPYTEITGSIDTSELNEKSTDFSFITDYIHKPVIELSGFYGINDKLSQLNNAKNYLNIDKQKYSDAISVLGRYR
jgi:hypothetical protein